jgi:hypothetical protein
MPRRGLVLGCGGAWTVGTLAAVAARLGGNVVDPRGRLAALDIALHTVPRTVAA